MSYPGFCHYTADRKILGAAAPVGWMVRLWRRSLSMPDVSADFLCCFPICGSSWLCSSLSGGRLTVVLPVVGARRARAGCRQEEEEEFKLRLILLRARALSLSLLSISVYMRQNL